MSNDYENAKAELHALVADTEFAPVAWLDWAYEGGRACPDNVLTADGATTVGFVHFATSVIALKSRVDRLKPRAA